MQAFPIDGFQEAVKVIERGAADHGEAGRLIQRRGSIGLPAGEFDLVAAEAQHTRSEVAMQVYEDAVAGFEVRLDERVLLVADAQEVRRNREAWLGGVDDDLCRDVLGRGQREAAEQGERSEEGGHGFEEARADTAGRKA